MFRGSLFTSVSPCSIISFYIIIDTCYNSISKVDTRNTPDPLSFFHMPNHSFRLKLKYQDRIKMNYFNRLTCPYMIFR